jgi:DNA polymerase
VSNLPLFLDFEVRSKVDLKKCGADVYARHPSTEILCTGFAFGDGPVSVMDKSVSLQVFDWVEAGCPVVAHNASFELAIWNHVCAKKYGWPPLKSEQVLCTMAMAYAMALPGALADVANAVNLPQNKDTSGHRVMLQLSQPRKVLTEDCIVCEGAGCSGCTVWYTPESHPDKFEKLFSYCAQDVEVERQLYKRLLQLSKAEREIWLLDRVINDRGVQIDIDAVKAAMKLVELKKEQLDQEMRRVTGGAVATCSAAGQLKEWLSRKGFAIDGVAKQDVTELLENPRLPEDVRQALLLRQEAAKSSTAKLEAMLLGVCEDHRLRGMFQYHGAQATGRWAGRRVQLQNLPRSKMKQEEIEEIFKILRGVL